MLVLFSGLIHVCDVGGTVPSSVETIQTLYKLRSAFAALRLTHAMTILVVILSHVQNKAYLMVKFTRMNPSIYTHK